MKMRKIAHYLLWLLLLPPGTAQASGNAAGLSVPAPVTFSQQPLLIETPKGQQHFIVEVAHTPAQRSYGLMFRKTMSHTHGMLFIWPHDQLIAMWMKNTLIPLDMLFIDGQGKIVYIARRTVPESTTTITPGDRPVRAVLELVAGTADERGINLGDHVLYTAFMP